MTDPGSGRMEDGESSLHAPVASAGPTTLSTGTPPSVPGNRVGPATTGPVSDDTPDIGSWHSVLVPASDRPRTRALAVPTE
jgi:hypothetical protein